MPHDADDTWYYPWQEKLGPDPKPTFFVVKINYLT
jgi:hypothetical protein